MASGPEAKIVKKIKEYLEKTYKRCFIFKSHGSGFQKAGIPDLICCINGTYVAIEVKCPGKENTLTELQKKRIDEINEAGGIAFMATSVEEVKDNLGLL